jgi:hypothetical protein
MYAYDLKDFLRRKREVEKSADKNAVNVRIHYLQSLKDGVMKWNTTDIYSFVIPEEISDY